MAKITRFSGNLVAPASAALGTERTLFGEVTQSDDLTDQFTADLLRGWGIVGPSDFPTLNDFNAMGFTLGQLHAYLHQVGVAEYNAAQEYHIGSIANESGVLYQSLINTNVGNTPSTSPASWAGINTASTETASGIVELATTAEILAGTDAVRAVTPAGIVAGLLGTAVFSGDGYAILPVKVGGVRRDLIVQWMEIDFAGTSAASKAWPIQFPNAIFQAFPCDKGAAAATSFSLSWRYDASTTTTGVFASNNTSIGIANVFVVGW